MFIFSGISRVLNLLSRLVLDTNWLIKKQGLGQLLLVSVWDKCMFWSNLRRNGF